MAVELQFAHERETLVVEHDPYPCVCAYGDDPLAFSIFV